jgi:O-antigen ligase
MQRPHRSPRYASFLVTGGVVGLVCTAVIVLGPGADVERRGQLVFYLGVLLAGIGALLGGLAAVVLEGRRETPPTPAADDGEARADP